MNVTNAKFKVGDVVEVVGDGLATKGKQGVIYKINEANKAYPYKVRIGTDYNNMYGDAELRKVMHNAVRSTNAVVQNALAVRNAKFNPYNSYKDFGEGVMCDLDDKGGKIEVTLKVGHGGSYITGTLTEIKAWRRKQEAKLKNVFSAIDKAEVFAAKWDGKPVESYND